MIKEIKAILDPHQTIINDRNKKREIQVILLKILDDAINVANRIGNDSLSEKAIAPGPAENPWNLPLDPTV